MTVSIDSKDNFKFRSLRKLKVLLIVYPNYYHLIPNV